MYVKINDVVWEIVFTDNLDNLRRMDGTVTIGVADFRELKIFLFFKLKGKLLRKVLIHELTHAYMFSYNFYLSEEEEEFICSFIDTYGTDIISNADELLNECVNIMCS